MWQKLSLNIDLVQISLDKSGATVSLLRRFPDIPSMTTRRKRGRILSRFSSPVHGRFDLAKLLEEEHHAAEILAEVLPPEIRVFLVGTLAAPLLLGRVVEGAAAVLHALEEVLPQAAPAGDPRQLLDPQLVLRLVQGVGQHRLHAEVALRAPVAFDLLLAHVGDPAGQLLRVARLPHLDLPRPVANVPRYRRQLRDTPASRNYSPHRIAKYWTNYRLHQPVSNSRPVASNGGSRCRA